MNLKSIFAMLGILALGFAIGFLTAGHLTKRHIKHIRKTATAQGFQERFIKVVELDKSQQQKLSPILKVYGNRFQKLHVEFTQNRSKTIDSLRQDIEGELTETQKERLIKFVERLKRPPHSKKRNKGKGKN